MVSLFPLTKRRHFYFSAVVVFYCMRLLMMVYIPFERVILFKLLPSVVLNFKRWSYDIYISAWNISFLLLVLIHVFVWQQKKNIKRDNFALYQFDNVKEKRERKMPPNAHCIWFSEIKKRPFSHRKPSSRYHVVIIIYEKLLFLATQFDNLSCNFICFQGGKMWKIKSEDEVKACRNDEKILLRDGRKKNTKNLRVYAEKL